MIGFMIVISELKFHIIRFFTTRERAKTASWKETARTLRNQGLLL